MRWRRLLPPRCLIALVCLVVAACTIVVVVMAILPFVTTSVGFDNDTAIAAQIQERCADIRSPFPGGDSAPSEPGGFCSFTDDNGQFEDVVQPGQLDTVTVFYTRDRLFRLRDLSGHVLSCLRTMSRGTPARRVNVRVSAAESC